MSGVSAELSFEAGDAFSVIDELDARLEAVTANFSASLADAIGSVVGEPVEVPVTADTAAAADEISAIGAEPVIVDVEADTAQAEGELQGLSDTISDVGDGAQGGAGGLDAMSIAAAGLAGKSTTATGALSSLTQGASAATVGIGALAAGIGFAVSEAADAQQVLAVTNQIIENLGTGSGISTQGVESLATQIQMYSGFSDEAIIKGAGLVASFRNVTNQAGEGNDVFDRTITLSADLARRLGGDVTSAAQQLGRALTAPEVGLSRLERQVGRFPEAQREMILSLAESGDLLGAQKGILDVLEERVGGVAQAYGETLAGQIDIAKESISEAAEAVGGLLIPILQDVVPIVTNVAEQIGVLTDAVGGFLDALPGGGELGPLVNPIAALGQASAEAQDGVSGIGLGLDAMAGAAVRGQAIADVLGILEDLADLGVTPSLPIESVGDAAGDATSQVSGFDDALGGLDNRLSRFDAATAASEAIRSLGEAYRDAAEDGAITAEETDNLNRGLSHVIRTQEDYTNALNTNRNGVLDARGAHSDLLVALQSLGRYIPGPLQHAFRDLTGDIDGTAEAADNADSKRVTIPTSAPGSELTRHELALVKDAADALNGATATVRVDAVVGQAIANLDAISARLNAIATLETIAVNVSAGRAAGGPVTAGESYLVGERGPEIFQPATSGVIIPNNEIGQGMVQNIWVDARGATNPTAVGHSVRRGVEEANERRRTRADVRIHQR